MGDDGSICRNISCPRSPGFLEYEQRMVALYAEAIRPDTVWIDDDLRMTNHGGIARGCFCPRCLEVFSAEQNRSWSRETLVAELTQNAASPVRFDWIAFNQSTLALFAGKLAEAAAAVHPGTRFALQCYHHALMYNGMNFTGVLQAMAEATGRKAGIRPGAGSYTDYDPRGQVVKAFWLGGMAKNSLNSGFADVACAENENYPHTITGKTAYGTAMEGALELAWGCNALSFVLNGYQTTSKEADACYWNEIAAWRPFYRALTGQGKPVVSFGFNFVRSMRHVSSISAGGWNWTGLNGDGDINTLLFTGIPVSWDDSETGRIPSVLTEDVAQGMEAENFREILKGNVLMSGGAFLALQQKGLTDGLGVRGEILPQGRVCREKLTDDPLNGKDAGSIYCIHPMLEQTVVFQSENPSLRVLSRLQEIGSARNCGIGTFMVEVPGSGKIAVFGHTRRFWREFTEAKHRQLFAIADQLFDGKLPVIAETPHSQTLIPLKRKDGSLYGVLAVNCTIEPVTGLTLELRGVSGKKHGVGWLLPKGGMKTLPLEHLKDGACRVRLPALAGWGCGLLLVQD